jgi:large subunit ribosomal protein L4
MKAAALRGALSDRARYGRVHVVSALVEGETPKTKDALTALRSVTEAEKILLVLDREDDTTWLSIRNVAEVHVLMADQLNTYDVLCNDEIVFTEQAYAAFVDHIGGKEKAK